MVFDTIDIGIHIFFDERTYIAIPHSYIRIPIPLHRFILFLRRKENQRQRKIYNNDMYIINRYIFIT